MREAEPLFEWEPILVENRRRTVWEQPKLEDQFQATLGSLPEEAPRERTVVQRLRLRFGNRKAG